MLRAMPGYWILTATARPSRVIARCTWPIDAAAIGTGSHSAKTRSGTSPSSSTITDEASAPVIGGALCCSRDIAARNVRGMSS